MDFEFNSEQDMLRKSFANFLSKECTHDLVKEWYDEEKGYSSAVWKKMADLGWMELACQALDETSDTEFLDAMILFEEIGKVLLPSPLFTSAAVSGALLSNIQNRGHGNMDLSDILDGKTIYTTAMINEKGKNDHNNPEVEAVAEENGNYCLNGIRMFVPFADSADYLLVCADVKKNEEGGPTIFRVKTESDGYTADPIDTLYQERKCLVKLKNVVVNASDIVGKIGLGGQYIDSILGPITMLKCGEMLGGMAFVNDTTVQYAKDRHQFGKPLGVFQAIQHYCADMAMIYDGAWLTTYLAASLINDGLDSEKEVAMAKAWISDSYKECTWHCQQIHGAIGYTDEYPVHLYYRHAKENELMFGDARYHREKMVEYMTV